MYELTIKFKTKKELSEYLLAGSGSLAESGESITVKPTKPRATKKAKPKVEVEKPVQEEIPVEEPKKEEPKEDNRRAEAIEALDTYLNIKKSQMGGVAQLITICNEVKSQLGIPLGTNVRDADLETIKNFHEQLSLTIETWERNKNKQERVDI